MALKTTPRRRGRGTAAFGRAAASAGALLLVVALAAGCEGPDASATADPATTGTPTAPGTGPAESPTSTASTSTASAGTSTADPTSATTSAAEPSATATHKTTADAGDCGWKIGADGRDGSTVDGSDKAYQLVVQTSRQASGASSVTVETAVAAVGDDALPRGLVTSKPTLLLARDGVVVARTDVGDGASADPDQPVTAGDLVAKVTTSGIEPAGCGSDSAKLPDGTYQVWALETVQTSKGKKTTLLGGGQEIEIDAGSPVALCGADVGSLPDGTKDVTLTADASYDVPDVDPATHPEKRLSAALAVKRSTIDVTGAYESTIYLVDDDGRIAADGTEPGHRTAGVIEPIAVSSGGGGDGRAYDQPATSCQDGKALAKGTYKAVVDLAVDRADGKPGVLHIVATSKDLVIR